MTRNELQLWIKMMETWTVNIIPYVNRYADIAHNRDVQRYAVKYQRTLRHTTTLHVCLYLYKAALMNKSYTLGQLASAISGHKNNKVHQSTKGRLKKILTVLAAYQLLTQEEVYLSKNSTKYQISATQRLMAFFGEYFSDIKLNNNNHK